MAELVESVSYPEYESWPAMRCSTLTWGLLSMEHLKAAQDGRLKKTSAALSLGKAIHTRLLEPRRYKDDYVVAQPCEILLKTGKRAGEACCARAAGLTAMGQWACSKHGAVDELPEEVVTEDEAARLEAIYNRVCQHDVIHLFRQHGGCEVCVKWEYGGLPLKCRLDKLILEGSCPPTIVDIKKVAVGRGGDERFSYAVRDYHYDVQAAYYVDAVEQATGARCVFIWVIVEDDYPHSVNVIQCDPATLDIGRGKYQQLLSQYKLCLESDRWPGYSDRVHFGGLPEYLKR